MSKILELRRKRAAVIKQARDILEAAEAQKRDLTAEEMANWNQAVGDAESLQAQIAREERLIGLDGTPPIMEMVTDDRAAERRRGEGLEYRAAWIKNFVSGPEFLNNNERRALQADNDAAGGYLITPLELTDTVIQAMDNIFYLRQWATKHRIGMAGSLGAPTLKADPSAPLWTSEIGEVSQDSAMSFGLRELTPHQLTKLVLVSRKLLRMLPNVEEFVLGRLAEIFAVAQENAFLTGSGSGQPLGVFTASAQGIGTGRDVSTANTTTTVTFDGLINAKYALKSQYLPRAKWLGHRDFFNMVAKLKDGDGQYLWNASTQAGQPDMLLGIPCGLSEYAPNTFTTGLYVGILGDFSKYWIVDGPLETQRLYETYATTSQVGLLGRLESDGMPILEEAFVRVTLA